MSNPIATSPYERILLSDNALKTALETLPPDLRFLDIIKRYFDMRSNNILGNFEDRQGTSVNTAIVELWEEAAKNADFLEDIREFEPLLKELGLRDHFVHAFKVFLLGYYIINKFKVDSRSILGQRPLLQNQHKTNLIWMLTATFHDAAYAVEKTDDWLNSFFRRFLGVNPHISLPISEVLSPVHSDIMRMLSQYHRSRRINSPEDPFIFHFNLMDWYYYNKLSEEFYNKNHGVLSALMLCHRMAIKEGFLGRPPQTTETPSTPERNLYDYVDHLEASHAISLHNIDSIKVKFREYPFAFILILCDEMQDWGRGSRRGYNDFISLDSVDEEMTTVDQKRIHEIRFSIRSAPERMLRLKETLRKRLEPGDTMKIIINSEDIFLGQ